MRVRDIWTKTASSFPLSLLSKMKSLLQTPEPKKIGPILIPAFSPRAFFPWRRSLSCLWRPVAEAKLQVVANERWDSHFPPSPYLWTGGPTLSTKHWKYWDPDRPCPSSSSVVPWEERWAESTSTAAHPPPLYRVLSFYSGVVMQRDAWLSGQASRW